MDRRKFLELAGIVCAGAVAAGCSRTDTPSHIDAGSTLGNTAHQDNRRGHVYVAQGTDPAVSLKAAVAAAGGLKFIKPGSKVVLKPNAAWARTPEQAATTSPVLIAAMVAMCKEAGASRVTVFEHTIDRPSGMVLGITGIGKAAVEAGADVVTASGAADFAPVQIPNGKLLKSDTMAKALVDADIIINMPKAKCHSQTELTLGLKNLMGANFNRQAWHQGPDLHQYIADYATAARINLTVMDATRLLMTNGPKGPGKTKDTKEVIVSFDPVAADAYACGLFGFAAKDVGYISKAGELGLGQHDISKIKIHRV